MNIGTFKVPGNILNSVLGYLATKPYNEVADLIAAIQNHSEPLNVEPNPEVIDPTAGPVSKD